MRRVIVIDGDKEYVLHSAYSGKQIFNDEWSEEMGKTPTFNFSIASDHENVGHLIPLVSEVKIIDGEKTEFYGRIITPQKDIYNTGVIQCIGGLSYLADSVQRPFTRSGGVIDFLEYVLQVHNSMVEDRKKLILGNVNVAGAEIERIVEGYPDTLTVLNKYLVGEYGGYLRTREEADGRYLDYLEDYGGYNSQAVCFGENLIDLSRQIDASELITCLIPTGAMIEVDNGDGTTSERVVKISEVNNGNDYIVNQQAVDNGSGYIWGSVQFDGVTDPAVLKSIAERYLQEKSTLPEQFEITAFDLAHVELNVKAFELGKWTRFESKPHDISATYLLKKLVRHITAPQKDKVVFGGTRDTISSATASSTKRTELRIEQMKQTLGRELNRKVENATQLITGGLGGYAVIGRAEDGHPEEILIMDAPDKSQAKNLLRLNKNGLGFSNAGYAGPYRNAWTIDGNMIADFITTGTMQADRIRGGTLEVGGIGTGKDGVILIKNLSGNVIGQLDKNGIKISKGTFSGEIKGGSIEVGAFSADDDIVCMGDWYVSADESNVLSSKDGSVTFQTAEGGPFGHYAVLVLTSKSGTTTVSDHHVETSLLQATARVMTPAVDGYDPDDPRYSTFYDIDLKRSWWNGDSITDTVRELWENCDGVSDERAKENIMDIDAEEAVTFLLNSRPVTFQYRRNGQWSAGFIAQEIDGCMDEQEIYFPIVGTDSKTGLYKVDYRTFIPLLVKTCQYLYNAVQELKCTQGNESNEE